MRATTARKSSLKAYLEGAQHAQESLSNDKTEEEVAEGGDS